MASLAILTVWLLTRPDENWVRSVNLAVWGLFVADYAVRLTRAGNRRAFVRENLLDLVAILPLDFLRIARAVRLLRLVRLLRVFGLLRRLMRDLRGILATNGTAYVLAVTGCLIVLGAAVLWIVEPGIGSFGDGLWWAIVTITTVGYGDISPTTTVARVVAIILMIAGIGSVGALTASIATYFIAPRRGANPDIQHVRARLQDWDALSTNDRYRLVAMLGAMLEQQTRILDSGVAADKEDG